MYQDALTAVAQGAEKKARLFSRHPLGALISTMLAGAYIGFGVILVFTVGGTLSAAGSPYTKLIMGLLFGGALSFVLMAGADLFTGNTMTMTVGALEKKVSWKQCAYVLLFSYIGNLLGALLLSLLMRWGNLFGKEAMEFILQSAETKMNSSFPTLFIAGILCNILVCLPVWCSFKLQSESAKLLMVFWGIVMFITPGFEHCVANMTLLSSALLSGQEAAISLGGFFWNILVSGLGNLVGGALVVGGGYYLISHSKKQ